MTEKDPAELEEGVGTVLRHQLWNHQLDLHASGYFEADARTQQEMLEDFARVCWAYADGMGGG